MILTGLRIQIAAMSVAVAIVASACGSGSATSDTTAPATTTPQAPTTAVAPATSAAPATPPPAPATTSPAPTTASPTTAQPTTPATQPAPTTDWANFEYRSAECGSFTPITLTNGEFTNQESAVVVTLDQTVQLDSGDTLVSLFCFAGPSGDTRSTELLLFAPGASELAYEKLPVGEPVINPDGTGSLEYDVYAPDDPRCCPSGSDKLMFTVTDGTILVAMP